MFIIPKVTNEIIDFNQVIKYDKLNKVVDFFG